MRKATLKLNSDRKSQLDEFILNSQVSVQSRNVHATSFVIKNRNQKSDKGHSYHQTQSEVLETKKMQQFIAREPHYVRQVLIGVEGEIAFSILANSSSMQNKVGFSSQQNFSSDFIRMKIEEDNYFWPINNWRVTSTVQISNKTFSALPKYSTKTTPTFDGKTDKYKLFDDHFQ